MTLPLSPLGKIHLLHLSVTDYSTFDREELLHLYKSEGRRGITKGFSLNIVKGPLALSISLTSYDYFMKNIKNFIDLELVVNSNSRFRDSE